MAILARHNLTDLRGQTLLPLSLQQSNTKRHACLLASSRAYGTPKVSAGRLDPAVPPYYTSSSKSVNAKKSGYFLRLRRGLSHPSPRKGSSGAVSDSPAGNLLRPHDLSATPFPRKRPLSPLRTFLGPHMLGPITDILLPRPPRPTTLSPRVRWDLE
jgi:hypothetical protein